MIRTPGLGSATPAIDAYNGGAVRGADRALGLYTNSNGNPTRNMDVRLQNDTGAAPSQFHRDVSAFLDGSWVGTVPRDGFVPEPATNVLLALGLMGLARRGRAPTLTRPSR